MTKILSANKPLDLKYTRTAITIHNIKIPAEEANPPSPYGIMGSMLTVTQLINALPQGRFSRLNKLHSQHSKSGSSPAVGDCQAIALEELSDCKD